MPHAIPTPLLFAGSNNYALNMGPKHAEQKNYQKRGITRLESKTHRQKPASYIMLKKRQSQNLKPTGSEPNIYIKHTTCQKNELKIFNTLVRIEAGTS